RLAHLRARGLLGRRLVPALGERARLVAPLPVRPRVRRDGEEIRPRLRHVPVNLAELREGAEERLLDEVLRVPHGAREAAAVAVEVVPEGLDLIEERHPRRADRLGELARQLARVHGAHAWVTAPRTW